jgi:hypothetical protein
VNPAEIDKTALPYARRRFQMLELRGLIGPHSHAGWEIDKRSAILEKTAGTFHN